MENPVIKTERLELHFFTPGDAPYLSKITSNAEVMRFFPRVLDYLETDEMLTRILSEYDKYGHCFLKVIRKDDGNFIGICGLLHQEIDGKEETEIGYRFLPEYWGKGYATEAAAGCIDYARSVLKKKQLIILVRPENIPSIKVAERLGATKSKEVYAHEMNHWLYLII